MATISVDIECGDLTCASVPSRFCKFIGTKKMGSIPVCMLFPGDSSHTVLKVIENGPKTGWLGRCGDCIESTKIQRQ